MNLQIPANREKGYRLKATEDWNPVLRALRQIERNKYSAGFINVDDFFLAAIAATGPEAEEDYTDERYWVARQYCDSTASDNTISLDGNTSAFDTSSQYDHNWTFTATNLAEITSHTHLLGENDLVHVIRVLDVSTRPTWHYYFCRSPASAFCTNSDYPVESDLDALASSILEISTTVSPGESLSDLKDDVTAVMARGVMYTDSEGNLNPWFAATLPLCVDSDYSTVSALGTLAAVDITADTADSEITTVYVKGKMYQDANSDLNPWFIATLPFCTLDGYETVSEIDAASISDITGDIEGDADDNFYAKGHIYQDADSDLNPWIVVDLSPGASKYLYDNSDSAIYGCVIITGLDLDSIGRVRRFRIYDYLATPEDVGWIGPEA